MESLRLVTPVDAEILYLLSLPTLGKVSSPATPCHTDILS